MSDIQCAVCREPFDAYGVTHGDMLKWEAKLFRQGAGCPSCQGVVPKGLDVEESTELHLVDRIMQSPWDDDADPVGEAGGALAGRRVPWVRPEPVAVEGCTCAGCGVSIALNPEDDYPVWHGGQKVHYREGYAWTWPELVEAIGGAEPTDYVDPAKWLRIGDQPYCPGCADTCDDCGAPVFCRTELQGDSYDEGTSFARPHTYLAAGNTLCTSCYESATSECGCVDCGGSGEDEDADEDEDEATADSADTWVCPGCGYLASDPADVRSHVTDCDKVDGAGQALNGEEG